MKEKDKIVSLIHHKGLQQGCKFHSTIQKLIYLPYPRSDTCDSILKGSIDKMGGKKFFEIQMWICRRCTCSLQMQRGECFHGKKVEVQHFFLLRAFMLAIALTPRFNYRVCV